MRAIWVASVFMSVACAVQAQSQAELKKRLDLLEERIAKLEAAAGGTAAKEGAAATKEELVAGERAKAKDRMRKDLEVYSREDLAKIEKLYQVASNECKTDAGKQSLQQLVAQYDKANRTGCALLYLGQITQDDERVHYLTQAIKDFGDCYYGDGVQVGAYARFYLAGTYRKAGQTAKAKALIKEIKEQYPNAIDHRGNLLVDLLARDGE